MWLLTSKWSIAGLILIGLILLLLIIGRKSVSAEVTIRASQAEVWRALTDPALIRIWNKVLVPVEGRLQEGAKVTYEFYQEPQGKPAVMAAQVKQLIINELINQKGGMMGVLTFDHRYILSATDQGTTVRIHERYRGIMVPFWDPAPVEHAYERLLLALKQELEKGQ